MAKHFDFSSVRTQFIIFLFFIAFFLLSPICLAICIPIYALRFLVKMAKIVLRPDLGELITTRSAVIAIDDPSNNPNWNLCVWLVLDGSLDFEKFKENFLKNVVLKKNQNGQLVSPEYQQFYYDWLGFLFWKWERTFDIAEHIRYYFSSPDDPKSKVTNEANLKDIIKDLTTVPFRSEKSPWEFLFIPNYLEKGDIRQSKCVLILRVHHGFCDGYTILWLLMQELNGVEMDKVAKPAKQNKNIFSRLLTCFLFGIQAPYDFVEMVVKSMDKNEWHLPKEQLSRPFNTAFTHRIPLKYIKDIKNAHGVSFTSVIYSSLTGGLRSMMIERGAKVPDYVTTAVAIPMPGHPKKLQNYFVFAFMRLPVGIPDPLKRLAKVEANFQKLKNSPATLLSFTLIPVFGGLFTWMINWFSRNDFSTALTSNFPGPPETIYFIAGGGRNKVLDMNFSAGMGTGTVGVGFCMMSYDHGMRIITSVDKSILPTDASVNEINEHILAELELLNSYKPLML